jgi:hypothetical protein
MLNRLLVVFGRSDKLILLTSISASPVPRQPRRKRHFSLMHFLPSLLANLIIDLYQCPRLVPSQQYPRLLKRFADSGETIGIAIDMAIGMTFRWYAAVMYFADIATGEDMGGGESAGGLDPVEQ